MSKDDIDHKKFLEAVNEHGDCPEELFKMAKTPFERMTAIEFFNIHKKIDTYRNENKNEIKWLTWLTKSVIIIGITAFVYQIVCGLFHI